MNNEIGYNRGLIILAVGIIFLFLTVNISGVISANLSSCAEEVNCASYISKKSDDIITCQYRNMTLTKKIITASDVESRKNNVGIRNPDVNYNVRIGNNRFGALLPTEEEWNDMIGQYEIIKITNALAEIPTSVDWSSTDFFPEIGHQGDQGSCSAWAMVYYSLGFREAINRQWNKAHNGDTMELLSPAWSYNMANGGIDEGASRLNIGKISMDWGAPSLCAMPYNEYDCTSWGDEDAWYEAPLHRAEKIEQIAFDEEIISNVKEMLVAGYLPTFDMIGNNILEGNDGGNCFKDGNFIISKKEYKTDFYYPELHSQCIVGYDDSITDDGDTGAFKIANSHGDSFGDNGFYWMTYDCFKSIGQYIQVLVPFEKPAYVPKLIASWTFDIAPVRWVDFTFTAISNTDPDSYTPYYRSDLNNLLPKDMCIDVTDYLENYVQNGGITFEISGSVYYKKLMNFHIDYYADGLKWYYTPPTKTYTSFDCPILLPGTATIWTEANAPLSNVISSGTYWQTVSPITITAFATDDVSGVNNVKLYYRYRLNTGTAWPNDWTFFGTDTALPWEWSFPWPAGQGHYQFYTIATDNAGNEEVAPVVADVGYGYDLTAPTSSVTPSAPYWRKDPTITITATASNGQSGVNNVKLYYRYRPNTATAWPDDWSYFGTDTASPWYWSFNWLNDGQTNVEGHYQFYTIAEDNAGNLEAAPTSPDYDAGYGYDGTAPSAPTPLSPTGNMGVLNSVQFSWNPVTDFSGIARYQLEYDGATIQEYPTTNLYTMPASSGSHTWRVRAEDGAGNWGAWSSTLSFYVTPPAEYGYACGTVKTSSGVAISWATVTAGPQPTSAPSPGNTIFSSGEENIIYAAVTTGADGTWQMQLNAGDYSFTASKTGYNSQTIFETVPTNGWAHVYFFLSSSGSGDSSGDTSCFTGDTLITTRIGDLPIRDVPVGTQVLTYNVNTLQHEYYPVTEKFEHMTDTYLIINNRLKVTPNHPVYINGSFTKIENVRIGDYLLDFDGAEIEVLSIQNVMNSTPVYNLGVSGNQNYFADGILVHNKEPAPEDDPPPNGGGGGGGTCLVAGTKINTLSNQEIDIEDISVGDYVLSYNETHNLMEMKMVRSISAYTAERYLKINNRLKITENHPVYVNGAVVRAGKIRVGDVLFGIDGDVIVSDIKWIAEHQTVYDIEVDINHNFFAEGLLLHNKAPPHSGPVPFGCPHIASWDGDDYVIENNILPQSENYERNTINVQDQYLLSTPLETKDGLYSLKVMEFENHHSFFDSFELFGLFHPSDSYLATSNEGEILAFDPESLIEPEFAVNSSGIDLTIHLSLMGSPYYGEAGEWVELNFGHIDEYQELSLITLANTTTLVKTSLIVQVLGLGGEWIDIDSVIPYNNFAFQFVDLKGYLPIDDDLIVRISWTSGHVLDVAWLYTGAKKPITYLDCPLTNAQHSIYGAITDRVLSEDNIYAEIRPYEEIVLDFLPLPEFDATNSMSFMLRTNGHYHAFNTMGTSQIVNLTFEIEDEMQIEIDAAVLRQVSRNNDGAYDIVTTAHLDSTDISSHYMSFRYHPEETYYLTYSFPNRTNSTKVKCKLSSIFDTVDIVTEGNGFLSEILPLSPMLKNVTGLWAHPYSKLPIVYENTPIDFQIMNYPHKDYSNYNLTAVHWNFGDGTESNELRPNHSFSLPGTYLVNLDMTFYWQGMYIVRDKQIYVTVPEIEPVADFDVYQEVSLSLTVTGRKGNIVGVRIYEDGLLIQSADVTRTAGPPNTVAISLDRYLGRDYRVEMVYDANHRGANPVWLEFKSGDAVLTFTRTFNANNGFHQVVTVPSTYLDDVVAGNPAFLFDASGSYDMDGEIVSYEWDFGDGAVADGIMAGHTYSTPGTYEVTLTVTDDDGLVAKETVVINIH